MFSFITYLSPSYIFHLSVFVRRWKLVDRVIALFQLFLEILACVFIWCYKVDHGIQLREHSDTEKHQSKNPSGVDIKDKNNMSQSFLTQATVCVPFIGVCLKVIHKVVVLDFMKIRCYRWLNSVMCKVSNFPPHTQVIKKGYKSRKKSSFSNHYKLQLSWCKYWAGFREMQYLFLFPAVLRVIKFTLVSSHNRHILTYYFSQTCTIPSHPNTCHL